MVNRRHEETSPMYVIYGIILSQQCHARHMQTIYKRIVLCRFIPY